MTNKMQFYAQMAEDAAKQITGSREQWTAFLRTAARLGAVDSVLKDCGPAL